MHRKVKISFRFPVSWNSNLFQDFFRSSDLESRVSFFKVLPSLSCGPRNLQLHAFPMQICLPFLLWYHFLYHGIFLYFLDYVGRWLYILLVEMYYPVSLLSRISAAAFFPETSRQGAQKQKKCLGLTCYHQSVAIFHLYLHCCTVTDPDMILPLFVCFVVLVNTVLLKYAFDTTENFGLITMLIRTEIRHMRQISTWILQIYASSTHIFGFANDTQVNWFRGKP